MSLPLRIFQYQQDWAENIATQPFTPFILKNRRWEDDFKSNLSFLTNFLKISGNPSSLRTFSDSKKDRDDEFDSFEFADPYLNERRIYGNPNVNNERVYYMETDYSFKLLVPYSHYMKKKKQFYTPFTWTYDEASVNKICQQSLYILKEISPSEIGSKSERHMFQIQLDRDKIDRIREQIEITFESYYKFTFFNKVRVEPSVELSKLRRLLRLTSTQMDQERKFDYNTDGYQTLVSPCLHEQIYNKYRYILDPILHDKCILLLSDLQKELYQMGYLDEQYSKLKESLEFVGQDINQTIIAISNLKRKMESANKLSCLTEKDLRKLDRVKKPHQLYSYFFDLAIKIRMLYNEAKMSAKLRYTFQKYIKIIVLLEIYKLEESTIQEWKSKLLKCYKQLQKKLGSSKTNNFKELSNKKFTGLSESDISIESSKIDIKKLIEEEFIDTLTISDIKEQLINIRTYSDKVQKFCECSLSQKDESSVYKIYLETANYLDQVDQLIQGICYAREEHNKITEKIANGSFEDKTLSMIEKEVLQEFESIAAQVKSSSFALYSEGLDNSKINFALNHALKKYIKMDKKEKDTEKAVLFDHKMIMNKLADIIRDRKKQKNNICMSTKSRVKLNLNVQDIVELFKSKKLWQAIVSKESHLVSIRGCIQKENKAIIHTIYCNSELEVYIMKIIKSFVNSLSESTFAKL